MRVRTISVVALVAWIKMTRSVSAQPYPYGWSNVMGWPTNPLGLTSEQMTQIRAIQAELQSAVLPLWTGVQVKNAELRALMSSSNPDPAQVAEKSKEVTELQSRIQQKYLETQNAVRELLTDTQKTLADQTAWAWGGTGGVRLGRGPCGMGLGRAGWSSGLGRGQGMGRGRGFAAGGGAGLGPSIGPGAGLSIPGISSPGWGRGPCGMGLGRWYGSGGRGRW